MTNNDLILNLASTLLGTIAGGAIVWWLAETAKKGKIQVFTENVTVMGSFRDPTMGLPTSVENLASPTIQDFDIFFDLQLYNTSDSMNLMKSLAFEAVYHIGATKTFKMYAGREEIDHKNLAPRLFESNRVIASVPALVFKTANKFAITFKDERDKRKYAGFNLTEFVKKANV